MDKVEAVFLFGYIVPLMFNVIYLVAIKYNYELPYKGITINLRDEYLILWLMTLVPMANVAASIMILITIGENFKLKW